MCTLRECDHVAPRVLVPIPHRSRRTAVLVVLGIFCRSWRCGDCQIGAQSMHMHTQAHMRTDTYMQKHTRGSAHTHTHTHTLVLAHCQNWSRGSPRERGERLKRNLGKMTQLAIEPPNGRHPLKSQKLWVDLKMIPLMGSPHLSKWVRTRCRKRIDGIRVSVLGSNCSHPCPQWR